ncbi:3,4-dihydroxyphenylacetaldehyde synthase 2-like [Teleopsis dalmanni]|uniref:3,4-dihydroxyphenylacetaldehyde synthase 2-like n=1 Tax=Teleopsis dalmanni TaxID=139649 RepID=UPI0018CE4342|nr:3,4-dihydroxyphenylacetaldehyde synthase 2-like [Teleopsis dalmanni]
MDSDTFREFGKAAVDFIADYMDSIRDCDVLSSVAPGYLFDLLPKEIPEKPEDYKTILKDIHDVIKPGITHWQSPNMHAFYPTASSFPSIVGEMLSAGFGVIGFNWICSPACTELEVVVMDYLAKFLNLPKEFMHSSEGPGGGIIQGSASEAVLVAVIAARDEAVRRIKAERPDMSESDIRGKLIAYSSDQSNSCVEKAGVLAALPIKLLPTDDDLILHGETLQKAIEEDISNGLIPVICIATLGTTGTCAYDDIVTLGPVCQKYNVWLHVDAAYAGATFALDEYAHLRFGMEMVDSFNFNMHKMLMINFDCTAMWLRDANRVIDVFSVDRIYLKHKYEGQSQIPDFRNWQIPLGRRFRALKVWITLRIYGAEGLRTQIRKHIELAKRFERFVVADERFEIVFKSTLGLVCFRPKGANEITTNLLARITERKKIYLIQANHKAKHFLRFVVCGMDPKEHDIDFAWHEIQQQLCELLQPDPKQSVPATLEDNVKNEKEEIVFGKSEIGAITQQLSNDLHISVGCEKSK